jgi:hypothetical protein
VSRFVAEQIPGAIYQEHEGIDRIPPLGPVLRSWVTWAESDGVFVA